MVKLFVVLLVVPPPIHAVQVLFYGNHLGLPGEPLFQAQIDSIHNWQHIWGNWGCAIPGNWPQPAQIYDSFQPGYSYYLSENCPGAGGGLYLLPRCSDGSTLTITGGAFQCGSEPMPSPEKNRGKQCSLNNGSDPINGATGNNFQEALDWKGAGPLPLRLERYYNSSAGNNGKFGYGWSHYYGRGINVWQTGTGANTYTARVSRPDGRHEFFNAPSITTVQTWVTDPGTTDVLIGSSSGWTLFGTDGLVEGYNGNGRLIWIRNYAGFQHTLSYDTAGKLTQVTDSFGRSLSFTYNANNKIATATTPSGAVYTYQYSSKNLISVTKPGTASGSPAVSRTYLYEDATYPHALTGILDENGDRYTTWTYDSEGRATGDYLGDGVKQYGFDYSNGSTVITDPLGTPRTYSFDVYYGVYKTGQIAGGPCQECGSGTADVQYDSAGYPSSTTDFNGNVTTHIYDDARGLETSRTEAYGTAQARTITTTWNPDFRLPDQIDEPARRTTFVYDAQGNRLSKTVTDTSSGTSRSWNWTYNNLGQMLTADGPRTDVTDVTTYAYYPIVAGDPNSGELQTLTDALGHVTTFNSYDADGNPLTVTDPNGLVTNLAWTRRGKLASIQKGTELTSFSYDDVDNLTGVALPGGASLIYSYDEAHRLTKAENQLGDHIVYTLDAVGNTVQTDTYDVNSTLTKTRQQIYDSLNRLQSLIDAQGHATVYGYDAQGNRTSRTDPLTQVTQFDYDALNRLIQITDPASGVTTNALDPLDQLSALTAPNSATTAYSNDNLGDRLSETSPDTGTTVYTYDAAGNVKTETTAAGTSEVVTISYEYDALNRVILEDAPGTQEDVTYHYDDCPNGIGRLCGVDAGPVTIQYDYDAYGNVTRHQGIDYSYDEQNRLESMQYLSGALVTYHYDPIGRISSVDLTFNGQTQSLASNIGYMPFGEVTGLTYGNGKSLTQTYDTDYRLTGQTVPGVLALSYPLYDGNSNLKQRNDGYSADSVFGYDVLDRLINATGPFGSGWIYDYDANGNRTHFDDGVSTAYTYEPTSNRLDTIGATDVLLSVAGNTLAKGAWSYTYTARNRLANASESGQLVASYTYNGLGQRGSKAVSGVITQYRYGVDGALLEELDSSGQPLKEYVYLNGKLFAVLDIETLDEKVIVDNGSTGTTSTGNWSAKIDSQAYGADYLLANRNNIASSYRWTPVLTPGTYSVYAWWEDKTNYSSNVPYVIHHGGQNETVYRDHTANGGSWQALGTYSFDGTGGEYIEVSNANGKTTADAVRLVKEVTASTQVTAYYVHTDHLGTPVAMTDEGGNVVWRASYAPFGEATVDAVSTVKLNVRFPGQYYDQETGLHYNYFRYYDPEIGRYLTADPIGQKAGPNLFTYVGNNPLYWIDPYGLYECSCRATGPSGHAPDTGQNYDGSGRKWCQYTCTRKDTNETKTVNGPGSGQFCIGQQGGDQFSPGVDFEPFTHDTESFFDPLPLGPFTNGPDFDQAIRNTFGDK